MESIKKISTSQSRYTQKVRTPKKGKEEKVKETPSPVSPLREYVVSPRFLPNIESPPPIDTKIKLEN